jgi:hypothetical protein
LYRKLAQGRGCKVCDKPGQIATQIKTITDLIGKEIGVVTSVAIAMIY